MRRPFLIFFLTVTVLVVGAFLLIQSAGFAGIVKHTISKHLPTDLGIEADFSEFAIQFYPPALSLKNPKITLHEHNILEMPPGSSVSAERMDFVFRPLQMMSGNVRVHELVILKGKLHLLVKPSSEGGEKKVALPKVAFSPNFHWDELFQIRAEAIVIRDSDARVDWVDSGKSAELHVKTLRFAQWMGDGGLGYEISTELSGLGGSVFDQVPDLLSIYGLEAAAHINASGVLIDTIHFKGRGFEAKGQGMVHGNLQHPHDMLNLDIDLSAQTELAVLAATFRSLPGFSKINEASARISFSGRARGNLMHALETLRLQGNFLVEDLNFRKFKADRLEAKGTWSVSPQGGEIELEKAEITARDHPRDSREGAIGGKILVDPIKFKIGSSDPVRFKLLLEHANVQWLGSLALGDIKPIYPLLFVATGSVEGTVQPPSKKRPLSLQANLGLKIDDLVLDNQKPGVVRKENKIFHIATLGISGGLFLDSAGLHADGMELSMPHSKLAVSGGILAKEGYALRGTGNIDFSDLGEIAENTVRGSGPAEIHVHGPTTNLLVDFDLDMKDAYYLHLALGSFKGRLTWDDDPNHLLFRHIQAQKGTTQYSVDGMLDLGDADSADLGVSVPQGNIQEFFQIFRDLTQGLSWFPQSLSGPMSGSLRVSGGLALDQLKIVSKVSGNAWDYVGERFSRVSFTGIYDKGKYSLNDVRITKRVGHVSGRLSFDSNDPEGLFDWDFHTAQMTVSDLDHVAQLDVPVRGNIAIDSTGQGRMGSIQSTTIASLTGFSVHSTPMASSQISLATSNGIHRVKGSVFGDQGLIEATYDFNPIHDSKLRIELHRLDFTPTLLLMNPKNVDDPQTTGYCSALVNLTFRSGQIERATGDVSISDYLLAKSDVRFQLTSPASFKMSDGSFDLRRLAIVSSASNGSRRSELDIALKSRQSELDGKISGDADVSLAEFVTSAVTRSFGLAHVDYSIGGTIKSPTLSGSAAVDGASLWLNGLESPFENVAGAFRIRQNEIFVENFGADLAGGRVTAGGNILLFADRYPQIALKGQLTGNKLRFFPFQYAKVAGSISVTGDRLPYLVEGKIAVDSALSTEKVLQQKQGAGLKAAQYTPPPTSERMSDYPKFKLQIDAMADKGILVQNDLFNAEFKAKVTVVNTIEAPRLLGNVDFVQGKMVFKGNDFTIESASATFDNPTVINPKFNLTSRTEINGVKVTLFAAGALDDFKIELSSTPVLSETDILSLLAVGVNPNDTRRLTSTSQSQIESGEAASLLLNSLDFNREVENKTGIQIQMGESVNTQVGTSVFRPQTPSDNAAAPKIIIKKQLTKNFDVSYGSTVGTSTANEKEVNAELKVTPGFSVIGVYDNYESVDTTQTTNNYSYGVDLKLQKRFK